MHNCVGQNLMSAVNSAVIAKQYQLRRAHAHGISIYFPSASAYNSTNRYYGNSYVYYPKMAIKS